MQQSRVKKKFRDFAITLCGKILPHTNARYGRRVITFHEIKDPVVFEDRIQWLQEHYELVPLDRIVHGQSTGKPMVSITFDDGYQSWCHSVLPILEEHNVPAVFFICSGFVGLEGAAVERFCRENFRREQILQPLSKAQLVELASHSLFEIGSHTRNHFDLGRNRDERFFEYEIEGDRLQLEDWTGNTVRWFAYPFGGYKNITPAVKKFLQKKPFRGAFTLIPSFLDCKGDQFCLGRDSLDLRDSTKLWQCWLWGSYDRLYKLKESVGRFRLKES